MKVVCWLNMMQPELAKAEALTLLKAKEKDSREDLLILETDDWQPAKRLALSRAVYEFWWSCKAKELWSFMDKFDWKKNVTGSFSVSAHHAKGVSNKQLADRIWHWLEKPVVSLKKPDTAITMFFIKDEVICARFLWANNEEFSKRRPHLRNAHHPTSCDPRLARAMVNLTGAPSGADLLDPFCGSGGLLIEAGMMGLQAHGSDIDQDMVQRSMKNCEQFNLELRIQLKDATHIYSPEKYVATDLPYGRGSGKRSIKELEELYAAFLERLDELLRVRAVIGYPSDVKMEKLMAKTSLKIKQTFTMRVHRSLTRKIVVLEPGKKRDD
jgi:tRNA (guanine10-N2)-dimethyltransferase